MRSIFQVISVLSATIIFAAVATAGNPTTAPAKKDGPKGDSKAQLSKTLSEMGLSDEQAAAVKQVIENHRKTMEKWKAENATTIESLRKQLQEAKKSGDESALASLKEQLDKIQSSRKAMADDLKIQLAKTLTEEQINTLKRKFEENNAKHPKPTDGVNALAEKLNLTEQQKAQTKAILDAASTKAQAASTADEKHAIMKAAMEEVKKTVLTDEQRATLEAKKAERESRDGPFSKLNLTDDQKTKIKAIIDEAKKNAASASNEDQKKTIIQAAYKKICDEVLTAEQREAMEKNRKASQKDGQRAGQGNKGGENSKKGRDSANPPPGE